MELIKGLLAGCLCFLGLYVVADAMLTLHDIRNELRLSREHREAAHVPHNLS